MEDKRQITIAIPTWNRFELLFESFEAVYNDERISEIVIVDDKSDPDIYFKICSKALTMPKVKVFINDENLDCYRNKRQAILHSSNDWCILFDSDNILTKDYIDRLFEITVWHEDTIYAPDYARVYFDYRKFGGLLITKENVSGWMNEDMFSTLLNTCNYFINKNNYLNVWDGSIDPVTSDSVFFAYTWLLANNKIEVVKDLRYFHRVHDGSHYKNNTYRTPQGFHESILNKLRNINNVVYSNKV